MVAQTTPVALTPAPAARPSWSFLTNHANVLVYVALHPDLTVRTIARDVGITERATLSILRDLDVEGIVERRRTGRRNLYSLNFRRLAELRRGGTNTPLTPRPFVDVVVNKLYEIALASGTVVEHQAPRVVPDAESQARKGTWGFFSNHMLVLLGIARDPSKTVRELAEAALVTERAAVAIINQLEAEGIVERRREGRRNVYTLDMGAFLAFRGWTFETWRIPHELIAMAVKGIELLSSSNKA
jgi:DNA-binding MarR family transcriptional regulator